MQGAADTSRRAYDYGDASCWKRLRLRPFPRVRVNVGVDRRDFILCPSWSQTPYATGPAADHVPAPVGAPRTR